MALSGRTANVQGHVLAFADRVRARAGLSTVNVLSGYRPGATILNSDRPSLHAIGQAVDLGTYYGRTLTRLGQAALLEAGYRSPSGRLPLTFAGTVGGWEIIFNSLVGGNHFDHLHIGWEGSGVPSSGVKGRGSTGAGMLNRGQLAALWIQAGGNRQAASMAADVALLESGGRTNARNLSSREDSRGLWQINVRAHPGWALRDLYNPRVNVQAAIAISRNGQNWSPWSTAERARARTQADPVGVPERTRPGGEGDSSGIIGGIGGFAGDVLGKVTGVAKGVWSWGEALVALVSFLVNPLNWLRLVEVMIGFSLLMAGLTIFVLEFTKAGKAVKSVTPAARVTRTITRAGAG